MEGNFRVADDRGLGKALLHSVFIEFKRRGDQFVDLNVEANNLHGAPSFYQRLVMTPVSS